MANIWVLLSTVCGIFDYTYQFDIGLGLGLHLTQLTCLSVCLTWWAHQRTWPEDCWPVQGRWPAVYTDLLTASWCECEHIRGALRQSESHSPEKGKVRQKSVFDNLFLKNTFFLHGQKSMCFPVNEKWAHRTDNPTLTLEKASHVIMSCEGHRRFSDTLGREGWGRGIFSCSSEGSTNVTCAVKYFGIDPLLLAFFILSLQPIDSAGGWGGGVIK